MVRVVRRAVGQDLGVDGGAAPLRSLELFEHEHAGAFADHEAGARGVERARRPRRMLLLRHEAAHRAEAGEDQRMEAGFGAARERGVRVTTPDQFRRFADRMRSGSARRDGCVVRPAKAERDRELPARGVDEDARDEGRGDPGRPALPQHVGLLHDPEEAADRRAEEDPHPARVVDAVELRIAHRLPGRAEREEHVPVELPDLLRRGHRARVEILHLRGDPNRLAARVVRVDEIDSAPALDGSLPGRRSVVTDRRHRAEPRDRYPSHSANLDGAERCGLRCAS